VWLPVAGLSAVHAAVTAQQSTKPTQDVPSSADRRLLDQYCISCHSERLKTGGLALDGTSVDINHVGANAEVWEKVVRKLQSGQMPPVGRPRPVAEQIDTFVSTLETALDRAAAAAPNPGRPVAHRLNRTEYTNAVRDLLVLDVDGRSLLPADDTDQHGFDNNGDVLSISPALLERYLSAARKISRLAVGRAPSTPAIDTYTIPKLLAQDDRLSEKLPFGSRGGAAIQHTFPVDGDYVIRIQLQKTLYSAVRGLAEPHELEVRLDRERIGQFTVGGAEVVPPPASFAGTVSWNPEWEQYSHQADKGLELRIAAKAGTHTLGVAFVKQFWEPEDVLQPAHTGWAFETDEIFDGAPGVETVTIEGPVVSAGPGDTESRRKIFVCQPRTVAGEEPCAKRILATLARRAYRRPVTDDDVATLIGFYRASRRSGTFDEAIEAGLERVLVAPDFLLRVEVDPAHLPAGASYRVSDIELASRLSFFLWSSIPDEELLDAAVRGKLKDRAVLEQQVERMLRDGRSRALVDNFASQWLQLRDLRNVKPDPDLFPDFDENLRDALRQETELFLDSQLRANRSVVELLTANYTFVNERLARHYDIPDIYGERFRRVTFSDDRRGGLLGQASLLTVTSYPNRTSPVLRGKWLLENILGTPPPAPPPDVPALKDKGANGERRSVRERLEAHRRDPACSSCHAQMDPLGFALEHFDGIGKWRTIDEGRTAVDASGSLPGGTAFEGLAGLRSLLLIRREQFVGTVSERLLSYALGRGVESYDRPAVRRIVRTAKPDDFRWSSIIIGIVESVPFQMRRTES
jgi:mono/diheme cytochrome c family protein